ncbi:hypothetical protein T439DRAFT_323568 [Meredithblackwellia eburnea MCA 4105]
MLATTTSQVAIGTDNPSTTAFEPALNSPSRFLAPSSPWPFSHHSPSLPGGLTPSIFGRGHTPSFHSASGTSLHSGAASSSSLLFSEANPFELSFDPESVSSSSLSSSLTGRVGTPGWLAHHPGLGVGNTRRSNDDWDILNVGTPGGIFGNGSDWGIDLSAVPSTTGGDLTSTLSVAAPLASTTLSTGEPAPAITHRRKRALSSPALPTPGGTGLLNGFTEFRAAVAAAQDASGTANDSYKRPRLAVPPSPLRGPVHGANDYLSEPARETATRPPSASSITTLSSKSTATGTTRSDTLSPASSTVLTPPPTIGGLSGDLKASLNANQLTMDGSSDFLPQVDLDLCQPNAVEASSLLPLPLPYPSHVLPLPFPSPATQATYQSLVSASLSAPSLSVSSSISSATSTAHPPQSQAHPPPTTTIASVTPFLVHLEEEQQALSARKPRFSVLPGGSGGGDSAVVTASAVIAMPPLSKVKAESATAQPREEGAPKRLERPRLGMATRRSSSFIKYSLGSLDQGNKDDELVTTSGAGVKKGGAKGKGGSKLSSSSSASSSVNGKSGGKGKKGKKNDEKEEDQEEEDDEEGSVADKDKDGEMDDEARRKLFLERNRIAACKSRQKKKERVRDLETQSATLCASNQQLQSNALALHHEVLRLRRELVMLHSTCSCEHVVGYLSRESQGGGIPTIESIAGRTLRCDYGNVPCMGSEEDCYGEVLFLDPNTDHHQAVMMIEEEQKVMRAAADRRMSISMSGEERPSMGFNLRPGSDLPVGVAIPLRSRAPR